jgi:Carboxypeptidase regulatory-like domain
MAAAFAGALARRAVLLSVIAALFACSSARAQYTTGTIQGTVFDPAGATVPNAKVTIQSLNTNETKAVTTGPDGIYVFPALQPGPYQITVEVLGFRKSVARPSALASQTLTVNITLELGQPSTSVCVCAEPISVPDDPNLTTAYSALESNDLPTERAITGLVALAPGVTPMYAPSGGGGLVKVGGAQTGLISANGGRPENVNVEFDFTDANDWEFGGFALGTQPQPDMIAQFNVLTSNLSAEYGIKSNGQIEMVTKSGTNNWHGQAYEYLQNNFFNATNPVSGTATRIDENNYGFSTGGPVVHDKTFLFGGWQQNKTIGGGFSDLALVPTQAARSIVTDPTLAQLINTYLPLPTTDVNADVGTLTQSFSSPADNYQFLLRGDQNFSPNNELAIRYFQGTGTFVLPFPQFNSLAGFDADLHYEARSANITDAWVISPNLVNQVRFAYARSLGLLPPENNLQSPRFTILDGSIASFGALPYFTQGRIFNVYQANDIVDLVHGKHSFKFGFDARYIQDNSVNETNDRGNYFFASLSNFLAAQPEAYTQAFGPTELGFRERLFSTFVQDDYRVLPTLTVNLGLRWEYQGAVTEAHGLTSLLDPAIPGSIGDAGPGPLGTFRIGNPAIHSNPANFGPRLGFAWNPGAGKFVLRGGYGIYYDSFNFTALSEARTTPPLNYTFTLANFTGANTFDNLVAGTAPFITESQAQVGSFGNLTNFGTITTVNPNLPNPYSQQWDLIAEYQLSRDTLASVAYVGSKGTHLQAFIPINPIAPANVPAPATSVADEEARIGEFSTAVNNSSGPGNNRVDPRFDQVNTITSAASSSYNSLQLSLREAFRYGLSLQASYTYSRSIDNSSSSNPNQESFDPGVQQNVNALYLERGPSNYDIPHRVVVTGVWNLPFFSNKTGLFSNLVLKGWQFSSTNLWQSGIPANIYSGPVSVTDPTNPGGITTISDVNIDGITAPSGADNTRANCAPGGTSFKLGNAESIAAQTRFSQPLLGNDGTCGRNIYRLNSLVNFNWAFAKNFRLTESGPLGSGPWELQFRTEVYNMFNNPNRTVSSYSDLTLTNPQFGLYDTSGSPRTLQLALRLIW